MLQIEVIGNIGADAEIKEFGGKKYVSFNVAHSERRKDANGTTVETTWKIRGFNAPFARVPVRAQPGLALGGRFLFGNKGEEVQPNWMRFSMPMM